MTNRPQFSPLRARERCWILFLWIGWAGGFSLSAAALPERVDFNFQIRPLLSDRCFKCHGPDEKSRKAKLRLDQHEGAFKAGKDGVQILVPGDPAKSELYRRITSPDPDEQMPPPDSNLTLTENEISRIRKWIEQGAGYKPHWSLIPLAPVLLPKVARVDWGRNPIDLYVLQRMERDGLKPSPEADKETLIRRLALDLTGLPPRIEEIDAYLADRSSDAYERLVDRLLNSPAYGEQMADDWLDLARYADTYGYQADVDRDMSPWRDWVIRALNENLPYDQFILWQIAGDLLPGARRDQILATAFNRLHRQTNEGGSIEEEFRTEYVADRLNTLGTAVLGLTLECSRCHDHKYDPITQKEYYRMFAFFNHIDESGLYSHFTRATPSPSLLLYREGEEEQHRAIQQKISAAEQALSRIKHEARERFLSWRQTPDPQPIPAQPVAAFNFETIITNQTPNSASTNRPAQLVDGPDPVEGRFGKAIKFNGDNMVICKGSGAFRRTDPFSFSLWLKTSERQPRAVIFHRSRAWTDSASRGYELVLDNGRPTFGLIHFWPGNAIAVRGKEALPANQWIHLAVIYDGSSRAAGIRLYQNGEPLAVEITRDHLFKDIVHRKEWGDADVENVELTLAARFRDSGFKNGIIDEFQVFDRSLTPLEIQRLSGADLPTAKDSQLFVYYLVRHDSEYQLAMAELNKLHNRENDLVNDVPEIMVMQEMPHPRPTYLLKRGAYDAPAESVEPGTPEKIMPFPPEFPPNRLGLARWLVDRRNPLTARVAVNRVWKLHFGRGLVPTLEDFGSQGQLPSHPELMDWLAHHLMDRGWDRKALHRLIVTSATYRQSSDAPPELLAADPDNRLLARGPKHRLPAQQIRDSALAASGLLAWKIGGPSVKPYQPAGLWEEAGTGKTYSQDEGEKLYRRSLYTFWRRTMPPPAMLTFDAASREVCTAKREITTTPLQALVLLNDPQFVEAARLLAEHIVRQNQVDIDARICAAFRLLTSRKPQPKEREILRRLYQEQFDYFSSNPDAGEKYVATGQYQRDNSLPVAQVAATAALASTLMNYEEFVSKR